MGLKYIMIKDLPFLGGDVPIIFPDVLKHSDVAKVIEPWIGTSIVSAGMLSINEGGKAHCFGEIDFILFEVGSRPEDSTIIEKEFNNGWK